MNEALKSANVPLNVVEGYIGEVSVSVPWRELKQKSCEIQITDLQLTLQPLEHNGHDMNQADLVSSMLSSMGSLASSIDIAKSLKNEELQQKDIEDYGVEQFAEVIDSILSRFRLVFMDTTIRLENEPDPESRLCTALEVQIDWIEFIDEQLNACQTHDAPMDAITSQPHSLSAIPDLNKLFHLKGIRFYTDVFSRPDNELVADDDNNSSSQVITSMYIRREKERTKRVGGIFWMAQLCGCWIGERLGGGVLGIGIGMGGAVWKTSSIESVTAVGDDVLGNMEESATSSMLAHSSISDYHSCYSKLDASEMSQLSPPGQLSPSSEARPVGQLALPK
ncbi:unnamed protein product, partial [Anisakis simplex]|uniref:Autophagy-related protein 2 n=1 Tax=Anisakis simplex TaxID=6269 RepID=A0A0M3KG38_ANISI